MLWRPHHLIRAHTKFDFLGKRRIALVVSTAINVLSLLGALVFGLNFGIDFEGGIAVQVRAKEGTIHLDELRSTLGALGIGEVSLQEFGDASTALIRVQRQEGNAQCVANAERVMKHRAGDGWTVRPGPAGTGDVEFTAPNGLESANWRDAVSRVGLTAQERQLPRGNTNIARIDMTPDQRAEWCQQVAIKLVEDTIGDKYDFRGTESVGPKIGAELMHSGVIAVLAILCAIAIYVWFRFEWQFGVGGPSSSGTRRRSPRRPGNEAAGGLITLQAQSWRKWGRRRLYAVAIRDALLSSRIFMAKRLVERE
jgi:preprotein translocase subunit SecF